MNIYDLINMKKDILINGYSVLEESYDYIESSPSSVISQYSFSSNISYIYSSEP